MGGNEYVLTHTWFSGGEIQYILIFFGGEISVYTHFSGGNEYVTPEVVVSVSMT